MSDFLIPVILMGVIFGALLGVAAVADRLSCDAKWEDAGVMHQWSFFGGCRVLQSGSWMPAENYRVLVQ